MRTDPRAGARAGTGQFFRGGGFFGGRSRGGVVAHAKRGALPGDPGRYRWIVDGHNAIFAHSDLERLQTGGEKGEARRHLEQMLERFAARYQTTVLIVYDGNRIEHNPGRYSGPRVSSSYTLAPEEADDRIIWMATTAAARGERIAVVSSDRRTLGSRLPQAVVQVEPSALYERLSGGGGDEERPRGRPPGDYGDIEQHFLDAGGQAQRDDDDAPPEMTPRPVDLGRKGSPPTAKVAKAEPPRAVGSGLTAQPAGSPSDLDAKKERGRRKHERRLAHRQAVRKKAGKRH